jgi:hypothetical protein
MIAVTASTANGRYSVLLQMVLIVLAMSSHAGGRPTASGYVVAFTLLACSRLIAGSASLRIPVTRVAHERTLDEQVAIQALQPSLEPEV